jgi:endonuclease YncB( thermonuclease family)
MLGLKLACLALLTAGVHHKKHNAEGAIVLNGERTEVNWTDGDSFKIKDGTFKGSGTRLQGYNTLEAYGPVHRWGEWTTQELFELAEESAPHAAMKVWECKTDGNKDGYGRLLISCPELTKHMVLDGYGMVYSVDDTPVDKDMLALQQEAIKTKAGMWKKGAPKGVITSLHSLGEPDSKGAVTAYNRVADTRTGHAAKREHQNRYDTCQEVCEKTDGEESCMVYVPFENRYKNRPMCLQ